MLQMFNEIINAFAAAVIKVLPLSPFQQYIKEFSNLPYLGYLNWFLPIGSFIKIGMVWLVAIGTFYIYSIVLRWIKAIS